MAKHFIRFTRNQQANIGQKDSKNSKKTTQRATPAIWRIFAELNNPLSPKLADKHAAIEDKLNIIEGGCYPPRTPCRGGKLLPPRSP